MTNEIYSYIGLRFKELEFEEQARVRQLMRSRLLKIVNGVVEVL